MVYIQPNVPQRNRLQYNAPQESSTSTTNQHIMITRELPIEHDANESIFNIPSADPIRIQNNLKHFKLP